MNLPDPDDYIDLHNHGGRPRKGSLCVESLMAHEQGVPDSEPRMTYTYGIHPWYLTSESFKEQLERVEHNSGHNNVIAIGEAGFDRLRGPETVLQREAFEAQVVIAEELSKPVIIHCVRAWDELLNSKKRMKPRKPWIIHGFRGKAELAMQLISKGIYISIWFDFAMRPESAGLVRALPPGCMFLETDGSGIDIKLIYKKVAADLNVDINELKKQIFSNYISLFDFKT